MSVKHLSSSCLSEIWKPASGLAFQAALTAAISLFMLLDMPCFWTTMAARFREQAAANCLHPFEEAELASFTLCSFS
jgi:hypothetical protein